MLFNSYEFIFVFMPATVAVFYAAQRISRDAALAWLIIASLAFYAYWRPSNVVIIASSLLVNFTAARGLVRLTAAKKASMAKALLALAIAFNLMFLGYFKYVTFFQTAMNDIAGTDFVIT